MRGTMIRDLGACRSLWAAHNHRRGGLVVSESELAPVGGDERAEAVARPVSRATAVKVGAVGLLGAAGAMLAGPDAAEAGTSTQFTAVNNGASDLAYAFATGNGSHAYTTGGNFDGIDTGVAGHSTNGNGVWAESDAVAPPTIFNAALRAVGLNTANAIYAVASNSGSTAAAVYAEAQGDGDGVMGVADGAGNGVLGSSMSGAGVRGVADGAGNGIEGASSAGNAVYGHIDSTMVEDVAAIFATNSNSGVGMWAESNGGVAVQAKDLSADTGAYGVYAQSSGGTAVYGTSTDGLGVVGQTFDGTGVTAIGQFGTALDVQGVSKFSRSGIKAIAGTTLSPKSSVKVTGVALTASSLVLATIQTNNAPGVFIQSAVPNVANSWITITLNQAVTVSVKVAWFVVN
jgi:hypothetical protein